MFAWTPIPEAFRHLGSVEFAKRLLTEAGVAVAPGAGFGEEGEGFVRIALVENEQRIRQAARSVKKFLERSEEHTSELQSLMRISYAVFCLKKKKKKNTET